MRLRYVAAGGSADDRAAPTLMGSCFLWRSSGMAPRIGVLTLLSRGSPGRARSGLLVVGLDATFGVAPAALQSSHLVLNSRVEGADVVGLPHHVGRDAGAFSRCPILCPVAAGMAGMRVEAITKVTQRVAAVMREEAIFPVPAFSVIRVEGVEVDVAAVAVEGVAVRCRAVAVNTNTVVGESAEDVTDATAGPVLVDGQLCERPAPVGEM